VIHYVEDVIDLDDLEDDAQLTAAVIYRRPPADPTQRDWIVDFFGEQAITVLWQDAEPSDAEWFARMASVATESLSPLAERSGRAFVVVRARQTGPTVELVIGPAAAAHRYEIAFGRVQEAEPTGIGILWLASMDPILGASGLTSDGGPAPGTRSGRVGEVLKPASGGELVEDRTGARLDLRGTSTIVGRFGPRTEQLILLVTDRRWSASLRQVVADPDTEIEAALLREGSASLSVAVGQAGRW
jgi:hypothetical protein